MQIDWLTVGAQILNFAVLVYLLKRFLYRPVLDAMDRREERIAQRLRDAERREQQADERSRDFREKAEELSSQRDEVLRDVRQEADAERRQRLENARVEVQQQRQRWEAELAREWQDVQQAVGRRLAGAVTEATRRALADLADTDLEKAMGQIMARRLGELGPAELDAVAGGSGPVDVVTAFEPDDDLRDQLTEAVRRELRRDVRFVRSEGIGGGVELRAGGWKLSWTVTEYLRGLEDRLQETIASGSERSETRG